MYRAGSEASQETLPATEDVSDEVQRWCPLHFVVSGLVNAA